MDIDTLTTYLQTILKSKKAEGIDMCGEIHLSPTTTLLPDYRAMIHKNEQANLQLLQTCLMMGHSHIIGA